MIVLRPIRLFGVTDGGSTSICVGEALATYNFSSLVPSPLPAAIFNGARKVVWHI